MMLSILSSSFSPGMATPSFTEGHSQGLPEASHPHIGCLESTTKLGDALVAETMRAKTLFDRRSYAPSPFLLSTQRHWRFRYASLKGEEVLELRPPNFLKNPCN
jgi:hypothetical protein